MLLTRKQARKLHKDCEYAPEDIEQAIEAGWPLEQTSQTETLFEDVSRLIYHTWHTDDITEWIRILVAYIQHATTLSGGNVEKIKTQLALTQKNLSNLKNSADSGNLASAKLLVCENALEDFSIMLQGQESWQPDMPRFYTSSYNDEWGELVSSSRYLYREMCINGYPAEIVEPMREIIMDQWRWNLQNFWGDYNTGVGHEETQTWLSTVHEDFEIEPFEIWNTAIKEELVINSLHVAQLDDVMSKFAADLNMHVASDPLYGESGW